MGSTPLLSNSIKIDRETKAGAKNAAERQQNVNMATDIKLVSLSSIIYR